MARRSKKTEQPPTGSPSIGPEKAIELIRRQIGRGHDLLEHRPIAEDRYAAWRRVTTDILQRAFGPQSPRPLEFGTAGPVGFVPGHASEAFLQDRRAATLQEQLGILESFIKILNTDIEVSAIPTVSNRKPQDSRKIFLVHGRDEAVLQSVARFLEKLTLDVVILHGQPNKGRTIIEKFVDYSDVGFAVVLLTPDDRGGPADKTYDAQCLRARQNVLLELGFFLGKLGRAAVCALYKKGVEIPSDYDGVVFVQLDDSGAWKLRLAREIKAAGVEVDMNQAV